MTAPETIPVEAVRLSFLGTGAGRATDATRSWRFDKTVPYMIVCQPTAGSYDMHIGSEPLKVETDEVWIAPANTRVSGLHVPDTDREPSFAIRFVHVSYVLFDTLDVGSVLSLPLKVGRTDGRIIGEVIDALHQARQRMGAAEGLGLVAERSELAYRLLGLLVSISKPGILAEGVPSQRLARLLPALRYVAEHLSGPIAVADLAHAAGMSASRFHRVFRAQMHVSPAAYVKSVRLREAYRLLYGTDLSVGQVADATGFANQFHFSREFKRRFGMPPLAYRKENASPILSVG